MKAVRDQSALRKRYSRLKEGFSHTESLGSQGGEENLQIMMMRSSTRKALEVSVECDGCLVVGCDHGPQAEVAQGVGPGPLVER